MVHGYPSDSRCRVQRRPEYCHQMRRVSGVAIKLLLSSAVTIVPLMADTIRVPRDYSTLQSAIDAASNHDTVQVAPGIYKERIRLKPGITLRSSGDDAPGQLGLQRAEATIIDGEGTGNAPGVIMASGSTLDGFTVTNVGHYDDALWNQHHATQGEEQSHEHIGQPGTPGISVKGISCTVSNNIVHHIGSTGIAIEGVDGQSCAPRILHNICYRNMGGGIGSMHGSTAVVQENTCFQNFHAGIGHNNASPVVLNNTCFENIRAGIGISEGACPVVLGNRCYRNRRAGIGTRTGESTRPIIADNECYENDMAGIGTEEHAAPLIRGNRCWKNKLAGIGSRSSASPTIVANECFENEKAGIGQEDNAVTVLIGNHCHHNLEAGIGFMECKAGHATVIDNRVIDNAKVAVGVHSGWTVTFTGNEFSRDGGLPPIAMVFAGADATFTKNIIRGGGVAGIRVAGIVRAVDNEFAGTGLRTNGPPNFGVWALPGSHVTLTGNAFHGWRNALHASAATADVINNDVRWFHKIAFVIQQSPSPASVCGNTVVSSDAQDKVLTTTGTAAIDADNRIISPEEADHLSRD